MKIVLYIASQSEDELAHHQFPLGAGYVGAYLEEHLDDVEVVVTAEREDILKERPDMVGISSVSQCFNGAMAVAQSVKKELSIPIIIGGYHISSLPHRLPRAFDAGVIGEGEKAMLEIVRLFRDDGALDPARLASIAGICFRDGSGVVKTTPVGEPVNPIDTLPFPKRNISRGARNIHMFTSRGCVYRCKYCASTLHWEKFRAHSAEYVVRELIHLVDEYDAKSIFLLDDLFFADKKRLRAIAGLMETEGLIGRFSLHGFITSNLAKRETLTLARHIGFKSMRFGAETGSDRLLKEMKGSWASVESHQRCIDLCRELGLEVRAAFMFGTPGETEEDIKLTYEFLKRNAGALSIDGFYLTTPIPGTAYWRMAMEKGLVSEEMDWDRLNLDILKVEESFDYDKVVYLNEGNMPLKRVVAHIKRFREEFSFHSIGRQPKVALFSEAETDPGEYEGPVRKDARG
jgi:radical SAM superfamily enzyme YgiQ (UPF0313 family)